MENNIIKFPTKKVEHKPSNFMAGRVYGHSITQMQTEHIRPALVGLVSALDHFAYYELLEIMEIEKLYRDKYNDRTN